MDSAKSAFQPLTTISRRAGLQAQQQPFFQGAGPSGSNALQMPFSGPGECGASQSDDVCSPWPRHFSKAPSHLAVAGAMPMGPGGSHFLDAFGGQQQGLSQEATFQSQALSACLHSFISSSKSGEAIAAAPMELLRFSEMEKARTSSPSFRPTFPTLSSPLLPAHMPWRLTSTTRSLSLCTAQDPRAQRGAFSADVPRAGRPRACRATGAQSPSRFKHRRPSRRARDARPPVP